MYLTILHIKLVLLLSHDNELNNSKPQTCVTIKLQLVPTQTQIYQVYLLPAMFLMFLNHQLPLSEFSFYIPIIDLFLQSAAEEPRILIFCGVMYLYSLSDAFCWPFLLSELYSEMWAPPQEDQYLMSFMTHTKRIQDMRPRLDTVARGKQILTNSKKSLWEY